jgi:hypothetical protein
MYLCSEKRIQRQPLSHYGNRLKNNNMEATIKKKRNARKRRKVQYLPQCEYLVADPFNTGN